MRLPGLNSRILLNWINSASAAPNFYFIEKRRERAASTTLSYVAVRTARRQPLGYGGSFFLRLIFAPRGAATALCRRSCARHPKRGAPPALSSSAGEPFKDNYRFLNVLAFLAQLRQHFCNVHAIYTPQGNSINSTRSGAVLNSEQK